MKDDIRKKFMDILFEPDEKEQTKQEVKTTVKKESKVVKKEVASKNNKGSSAFIDLEKKPQTVETAKVDPDSKYEFTSRISPIFGVLEKAPVVNKDTKTNDSLTTKPEGSHLNIVPSPIYGYGKREEKDHYQEEIHRIFADVDADKGYDETIDLFSSMEEEDR